MHETGTTRRRFLEWAGGGAAAALLPGARRTTASEPAAATATPAPTPSGLRLGLASYTTRKLDLEGTIGVARRVGLRELCLKSFHLPLDASPERVADAVRRVRAAGLRLYGGGVIYMKSEEATRQAFAYARAAGMTTIVGVPTPPVLPLVDALVKEHDIRVAIHNHGPGDKVYPTPESVYRRVERLDARIGLCIDIGHTIRIGADPVKDVARFADRLLDVHLKDVSEAAPGGREVEVGRGVIDIPALVGQLVRIRYGHIASFEYEKDPGDPLAGLAESVGYVRGILATLGSR